MTTVLAVDDHPLVVEGLMSVASRVDPSIELVGSVASLAALRERLAASAAPDVALVDLRLGDGSTPAQVVGVLHDAGVGSLILTAEVIPDQVVAGVRAGAGGLALKSDPADVTISTLREVASGGFAVTGDLAFALLCDQRLLAEMTAEEAEVLALLAEGIGRADVGDRLVPPRDPAYVDAVLRAVRDRLRGD